MDLATLNERIVEALQLLEGDGHAGIYFGWYWRDVDDWEDLPLRASPEQAPAWYAMTAESMWLGQPWFGRQVRFCVNDKWGYDRVEATEDQRLAIIEALDAFCSKPSVETVQVVYDRLQEVGR